MAVSLEGTYRLIDRASPSLRDIERRAQAADRALDKLGRTMDRVEARSAMSKVTSLSGEMGKLENQTGRVERALDSAGASQRTYNKGTDDNSRKTRTLTSDMGKLETAMRKVVVISSGLGKVLAPGKMLAIVAAIQPIVSAISALGAGAIGLVQQVGKATGAIIPLVARLGDLAGAGAAAVTVMLSVKAAAAVTKFAMGGVSQAINGNIAAFKKLTPEARAFVMEMRKLQPVMNTLKASAQKGLFSGLTGAVRTIRNSQALPVANTAVGGIGTAVGGVAQQAASALTNPSTLRDLAGISATMDVVITKLGNSAINLAQAFISILAAAQPLTRWLVSTIDQWSKYLLQQVEVARQTGALSRYFDNTRRTLTVLGHAVRDFGIGFINVMRVARGESGNFGHGIDALAKNFRDWTESFSNQAKMALWFENAQSSAHRLAVILEDTLKIFVGLGKASGALGTSMTMGIDKSLNRWATWVNSFKGQNELSTWFNSARTTLGQLWGLVSDISVAFIKLGQSGPGATGLIAQIRTLVPDLVKVIQSIGQNIGPGLFTTVQQLAHLFATLTAASGSPLGQMLNLTASILTNVNDILDRFKGVRVAAAIAFTAVGGALLLQKLSKAALGVDAIAVAWRRVSGATQAATATVEGYDAAVAGAAAGGAAAGMGGASRAAMTGIEGGGAMGFVPVAGASAETAAAEERVAVQQSRVSRLKGALGGRTGALGLGLGVPVAAGVGASLLQSKGVIGGGTAGRIQGIASGAATGAIIGSMFPGPGTLIGAGLGAGAGFLTTQGGGGPSAAARYTAALQAQAQAKGFDITQIQGGAQNLSQANAYQGVLDRSRMGLQSQRSAIPISAQQATKLAGQGFGGIVAQAHALDQQLAVNQKLRDANIARLGVERQALKVEQAKTAELQKQARASQSRDIASKLLGSYGAAYNIYRKGGQSVDQATATTVRNMESRAKTLNPAGAQVLFQGGTAWLAQMKKQHPELSKEYDSWNTEMKATLKKMGVTIAVSGDTVLKATTKTWKSIQQSMQDPAEKAREFVSTKFTDIQMQGIAVLEALGQTSAQASLIIQAMENGKAGPSAAQLAAAGQKAVRSVATATGGARGPHRARGGRIPGVGLSDTVPVSGFAAPGELVTNRHTESRVDRMLAPFGTSLGREVAGERKKHSDILPGFALGGRVGAAVNEANRIGGLRSTYLYGGGHVTPAPSVPPWDCSSSTSRVLQAAGYDIPTMTAQQFMSWGLPGEGAIGVEASPGHVYMMLNGKPWGTSYSNYKGGPGWIHNGTGYRPGFVKRHAPNAGGAGKTTAGSAASPQRQQMSAATRIALGFQGLLGVATSATGAAHTLNPTSGGGGGGTPSQNQALARAMMISSGQGAGQWPYLQKLWTRESGFSTTAKNPSSGAYGIPQSLPASKMASAGADYLSNPRTQVKWGLGYISGRYGSPQAAWAHELSNNWYAKGGRVPEWGGWHAGGLDHTFDKPTMIGVGEAGRERVTVTPSSGSGGHSATSGGVHINWTGDLIIRGGADASAADIRKEIDQALEELARRIETQSLVEAD